MDLKISTEEMNALMQCQPEVRYQYTLKRIADTESMWSLVESEKSFVIQTYGDKQLFPIWSSKEYAQAFGVNNRANFRCTSITLDYFEEAIIDFICSKELLINVFPTAEEPLGKIVSLNKFAEDLSILLEDYE